MSKKAIQPNEPYGATIASVTYDPDEEAWRLLCRDTYFTFLRQRYSLLLAFVCVPTVLLLFAGQFIALGIAWLVLALLVSFQSRQILLQKFDPRFNQRSTAEIQPEALSFSGSDGLTRTSWSLVDRVELKGGYIYVSTHGFWRYRIIPCAAFETFALAQQFAEVMERKRIGLKKPLIARLGDADGLAQVTISPPPESKLSGVIIWAMVAVLLMFLSLTGASWWGSHAAGVVAFFAITIFVFRIHALLPPDGETTKTVRLVGRALRTVSLVEEAVHVFWEHEEQVYDWNQLDAAINEDGKLRLQTESGAMLVEIPESDFQNPESLVRFMDVVDEQVKKRKLDFTENAGLAEAVSANDSVSANPYAPPQVESTTSKDGFRIIEYDLAASELRAGAKAYGAKMGRNALGAIVCCAAVAAQLFLMTDWLAVATQVQLATGGVALAAIASVIAYFVVKQWAFGGRLRYLESMPLFATGRKRVAFMGNTIWLEAAKEECAFPMPQTVTHGSFKHRIVFRCGKGLVVIPRSAVSTEAYEYLCKLTKQHGVRRQ